MVVDPILVGLMLLAALMHASWNAVLKLGEDRLIALALLKGPVMIVSVLAILAVGLPAIEGWPYLLGSTLVSTSYFVLLAKAYEVGDLSLVYPIARGSAPILVLGLSVLATGEVLTLPIVAGVLAASLGIIVIGMQPRAIGDHSASLLWAGLLALTIASYTVIDGLGGRVTGNPIGYTALLHIMTGIPICLVALHRRGMAVIVALKRDWAKGLAGGTLMLGSYTIAIYALSHGPMAPLTAARESGVIFAAIIGAVMLKESFGPRRIAGAGLVAAGIAIMVLGR